MEVLQENLQLIIPLLIIQLILLGVALVDLVRREKVKYLPKWVWAIIILLISMIGPVSYLIIGREED
jgi:glucose uptake protein GlcU